MRSNRSSTHGRKTTVHTGPLPRLVRALWRITLWIGRALLLLIKCIVQHVSELRSDANTLEVVALLTNRKRARGIERSLRSAFRRHARAFGLELTEPLLVVVRETVDSLGEKAAEIEHEPRADGSTRYVIALAAWPVGARLPLGPDALVAELSRQLVRLQHGLEGSRATPPDPITRLADQPSRNGRLHVVAASGTQNGQHPGPFDGPGAA